MNTFDKYLSEQTILNDEDKKSLETIMEIHPYFLLAKIIYAKRFINPTQNDEKKRKFNHIVSLCFDKSIFYQPKPELIADLPIADLPIADLSYDSSKYHSDLEEIFQNFFHQKGKEKISRYDEALEWKPEQKTDEKRIIDRFISSEPNIQIKPDKEKKYEEPEKRVKNSQMEYQEMVTESLAKLHAKQGNITKAISMYKRLQLQFPEKFSYFADQIELLQ